MGYYNTFLELLPKLRLVLQEAEIELSNFDEIDQIYNPFNYGIECYLEYLKKYFYNSYPKMVVLGLNPGIDGAVQTCIPFTDVNSCYTFIEIDPQLFIKKLENIDPSMYLDRSKEPTSRLFFKAIHNFGSNKFLSNVLLLNAFPLGIGQKSLKPNKGGFMVKNVVLTKASSKLKTKVESISVTYLKKISETLPENVHVLTLSGLPRDILNNLGIKNHYYIHPSPTARNRKNINEQKWIEGFNEILCNVALDFSNI